MFSMLSTMDPTITGTAAATKLPYAIEIVQLMLPIMAGQFLRQHRTESSIRCSSRSSMVPCAQALDIAVDKVNHSLCEFWKSEEQTFAHLLVDLTLQHSHDLKLACCRLQSSHLSGHPASSRGPPSRSDSTPRSGS